MIYNILYHDLYHNDYECLAGSKCERESWDQFFFQHPLISRVES